MRKLFTLLVYRQKSILKACFILLCCFSSAEIFAQTTGFAKCYADKDHDGFGDPTDFVLVDPAFGCELGAVGSGRVDNGLDCNDNDANEFPGKVWYKDVDKDGFTDGATIIQCTKPSEYYTPSPQSFQGTPMIDCDDTNPYVTSKLQGWFADPDNDGYISINNAAFLQCAKPPGNYVSENELIANGSFVPGCNNTCNVLVLVDCNQNDPLELPNQKWYPDVDGDGYGATTVPVIQCTRPPGYKTASEIPFKTVLDCNDNDPLEHPDQIWYADFDNDGYSTLISVKQCSRPVSYKAASELKSIVFADCNDADAAINPETIWYQDFDGDGYDGGFLISRPDCSPCPSPSVSV